MVLQSVLGICPAHAATPPGCNCARLMQVLNFVLRVATSARSAHPAAKVVACSTTLYIIPTFEVIWITRMRVLYGRQARTRCRSWDPLFFTFLEVERSEIVLGRVFMVSSAHVARPPRFILHNLLLGVTTSARTAHPTTILITVSTPLHIVPTAENIKITRVRHFANYW